MSNQAKNIILNKIINNEENEYSYVNKQSADDCTNCGLCVPHCPVMRNQPLKPKTFFIDVNASREIALSCVNCNLCSTLCKKDLDVGSVFKAERKSLLKDSTEVIKKGLNVVLTHQKLSFSKLFTVAYKPKKSISRIAFMPGCSLSNREPQLLNNIYTYLKVLYPGISYLQQCCGKPTLSIGKDELFKEYYSRLESDIETLEVDTIITACENCYMMLKNKSPNIKTISLYEALLIRELPEQLKTRLSNSKIPLMALHDPCPTRNEPILHDSTRKLLTQAGIPFKEFKFNRNKTLCCGSGNMASLLSPNTASEQAQHRVEQAKCDNIVTYCQSCTDVFNSQGKNTLHLLELLFDSNIIKREFKSVKRTTLGKWKNRFFNTFTK
jgi:Fe-S oxidoreductase